MDLNQTATEKKSRQLNYEILRILAMMMIVSLHYFSKGGLLGSPISTQMGAINYTIWLLEAFCLVAVNVYVLISGYFGVGDEAVPFDGKKALRRPLKIWLQVLFYSVIIGTIATFISGNTINLYQIFNYVFPILTEHYWFATAYIVLCFLMPFLNEGFNLIDKKTMRAIIFALLIIFSISKTVIPMKLPWEKYGYDAYWFVVLYLTGGYLRRYGIPLITNRLRAAALYIASALMIFVSFIVLRAVYFRTGSLENFVDYAYSYNHFLCYIGAIGLFLVFRTPKELSAPRQVRNLIELFSGAAFGVYLIHEHIDIRYRWVKWFKCSEHINSSVGIFLIRMLLTVVAVYLICSLIEMARIKLSGRNALEHLLALVLFIYPLRKVTVGVDLMDAGYALGNYRFFDTMNPMWRLATYLANVTGALLTKLPYGDTWIGMNIYTSLFIGAAAAGAYLFFVNRYGEKSRLFKWLLFAAELTALSLCWAPSVILYHYLGYIMMTAASLILFKAITDEQQKNNGGDSAEKDSGEKNNSMRDSSRRNDSRRDGGRRNDSRRDDSKNSGINSTNINSTDMDSVAIRSKKTYIIAGVILGLAVAVRMPNITYMAFILPLWYYCIFIERKGIATIIKRTLYCIIGYCIGMITPIIYISIRYGAAAYPNMISSLFGMTDTATDYKPTSMITAMFGDYISYSPWLLLFVLYIITGVIVFTAERRFLEKKAAEADILENFQSADRIIQIILKTVYILGLLVLLRLCYGKGMFDFDYTEYFCMYKWLTVYLLTVIALSIWTLVYKESNAEIKLWAVFALVTVFITPLGSNNGLYPVINNLFIIAPVSILLLHELFQAAESRSAALTFPLKTVTAFVFICVMVQSLLFGAVFVFHDEADSKNSRVALKLESSSIADGLKTTAAKKEVIEALDGFMSENSLTSKSIITFGDVPALSYIFDMPPAVSTTWADLDSNSLSELTASLERIKGDYPVIIIGADAEGQKRQNLEIWRQKLNTIESFINENKYAQIYSNDEFIVYARVKINEKTRQFRYTS